MLLLIMKPLYDLFCVLTYDVRILDLAVAVARCTLVHHYALRYNYRRLDQYLKVFL